MSNDIDISIYDEDQPKSPLKAIRKKCVDDCCAGLRSEARRCDTVTCPLHPFRFGKSPFRKKLEWSEERKKEAGERLKKAREAKKKA